MKKNLFLSLFAVAFMLFLSSNALARDITIVNSCGFPLYGLDISDTNSSEGNSLLDAPLANGDYIVVDIPSDSGWDLIAMAEDQSYVGFENISFAGVSTVYLHGDGTITGK